MKKLKIIVPLIIGFFLVWYTYNKFTPEQLVDLKTHFTSANYFYIAISMFLGVLSHFSRAYRWKYTLEPLGYRPSLPNSLMAVGVAYLMNLAIPRSGEVSRALVLSKYENVPFEKGFGTIVAERIADFLILIFLIIIGFISQFDFLINLIKNKNVDLNKLIFMGIIALLVFIGGFIFLRKTKSKFGQKIKDFVLGLKDGVFSILTMKKKWHFIGHTLFIWIMYITMFYVCFFALPETSHVTFGTAIIAFIMGTLSVSFTNGGLGSYPFLVAEALLLFGIDYTSGTAFGWIVWACQTLIVVIYGGVSFVLLPLYNKK